MKSNKLLITLLLLLPTISSAQTYSKMVLVTTANVTGDQYFVDPTTIENLDGSTRVAWILNKSGYKDTPRPIFGSVEGKLLKAVYKCGADQFTYIEAKEINRDGGVIRTEYSMRADDPRNQFVTLTPGSIGARVSEYVCKYNVPNESGNSPTASKILAKHAATQDWASLGPDSNGLFDFYLLKNSVTKRGNYIGYVTKGDFKSISNKNGVNYKTVIAENISDCKQNKSQILKSEYLDTQGKTVLDEKIDPEFAPWVQNMKGSFFQRISDVYCK